MSDPSTATRRRVLAGTGATVAPAGCAGLTGDDETETPTPAEESTDTPAPTAQLRVAHTSPSAPDVDVHVDGTAVLEDIPFGAISGYLEVPVGEREVEITPAGDTVVLSGGVPVETDTEYTVAAVGEIGDDVDEEFEPLVLEDDNSDPGDGSARVQVVHASSDAPAVDVTVAASGDAIVDGVAYGQAATAEVPAGEYTRQVRGDTAGNDGDVVAEFDVSLEGGTVYTAFAAGYLTPDDEPSDAAFDLLVTRDAEA